MFLPFFCSFILQSFLHLSFVLIHLCLFVFMTWCLSLNLALHFLIILFSVFSIFLPISHVLFFFPPFHLLCCPYITCLNQLPGGVTYPFIACKHPRRALFLFPSSPSHLWSPCYPFSFTPFSLPLTPLLLLIYSFPNHVLNYHAFTVSF